MHNYIELQNITKKYKIFFEKPSVIKTVIPRLFGAGVYETIYAVNDLSLNIKSGDCVALIGDNGSGKSTLLRLIAGLTSQDNGTINVNGKISTLLEVSAGFHPELTGRENIFLNSALFGFTPKQINNKFNQIVEYSGLNKFIDSKLITYSTGMTMRLAFSVAVHADFDILLIDEVIAVGDIEFQKQSSKTIHKFIKKDKKTVIIVSHQMAVLEELCNRAILLEHGKIIAEGKPKQIIKNYQNSI